MVINMSDQIGIQGDNATVYDGIHFHQHSAPPPEPPRQLPALDACFLGRDKELAELIKQLHPGKVVAVCGPGGMGKSALAAQAVQRLEADRFPDGIVYHRFYDEPHTDQVLQTICNAYQMEAKAGLAGTVRQVLAGRKALLILDGTEEADDLKAVLALHSTCGVLITSRKKTDAQGFRLDLKPLEEQPAAAVFCEHSGVAADDESVAGICKILDGWPVGLRIAGRYCSSTGESAAGYLRWLAQEPFKELGSGKHEQENAALLLRRSVAQVSDDARLALGLAGTLAFAPIARKPVAAILDGDERRARKALGELVNYGLLETKEERWQISHALVHTYARTELALSKESLKRLAWLYIHVCQSANEAGIEGYAFLDSERAHCLRLMESCLASELWLEVQVLEGTIDTYLDRQCWWTERLAALEMRQATAQQTGDRRDEGVCLNSFGCLFNKRGEIEEALSCFKQSLSIRRALGDRQGESMTLNNIAESYRQQGNYKLALQIYQESLSIKQEIGDRKGEGVTLSNIALLYKDQGDYDQALIYSKQCLPIRQETGDKIGEAITRNNIASIYYAQGKRTKAMEYYKQALAIRRAQGDRAGEAESCWNIGRIYEDMNDLAQAEEYITLAVEIEEQIGHPDLEDDRKGLARVRAKRQGTKEA